MFQRPCNRLVEFRKMVLLFNPSPCLPPLNKLFNPQFAPLITRILGRKYLIYAFAVVKPHGSRPILHSRPEQLREGLLHLSFLNRNRSFGMNGITIILHNALDEIRAKRRLVVILLLVEQQNPCTRCSNTQNCIYSMSQSCFMDFVYLILFKYEELGWFRFFM